LVLQKRLSHSQAKKEASMFRKMLVLALLLSGVGGCIWREDRGRQEGHRDHRESVVVTPAHVHCDGCGHVLRGGIWVGAD
jgi:hypothetical protein